MKKLALVLIVLSTLLPIVSADLSQEGAVSACRPYSSEGETISIIGPIICDGEFWVCQFIYYGNDQSVLLAIDKDHGNILDASNSDLKDIVATSYALSDGSYLFDNILSEYQFAMKMGGLNNTLTEYARILDSLKGEELINSAAYKSLTKKITTLKEKSNLVTKESLKLNNISSTFIADPGCVELLQYQNQLNSTLDLALNFTELWKEFITSYNNMASEVEEIYVATIKTSDVELMYQSLSGIEPNIVDYQKYQEEYIQTVLGNTKTRFERKQTSDYLEEAYKTLKTSNNPAAQEKYNEASEAFSDGDYNKANRLVRDALQLPHTINNENPVTIVEKEPDYMVYVVAVGILLGAIFILTILKGKETEEEDYGTSDDEDDADYRSSPKSKKPKKAGEWTWVKEKESSMERKASKSTLETD